MTSDDPLIRPHLSWASIRLRRAWEHWPMTSAYTLEEFLRLASVCFSYARLAIFHSSKLMGALSTGGAGLVRGGSSISTMPVLNSPASSNSRPTYSAISLVVFAKVSLPETTSP